MGRDGPRHAALAALLSALLPGLGQWYNRQWGKGVGFFLGLLALGGILLSSVDPDDLLHLSTTGMMPHNIGRLFLVSLLILGLALWSIADAAWVANRQNSNT